MAQRTSLFSIAERIQGSRPWGAILDAGTGVRSATWLSRLPSARLTLVSADPAHLAEVKGVLAGATRAQDRMVCGNWSDPGLLAGEVYDTVIADYLLGAVEGYAPYRQEGLFARLRPLVGGRLYVLGVDPYILGPADGEAGRLVQEIGRLRDAAALLAGVVPYREFPAEWVVDRLQQAGMRLIFADRFVTSYDATWIARQIADCRTLAGRLADAPVAGALAAQAISLERQALAACARDGGLRHGHEYVIVAEPHPSA